MTAGWAAFAATFAALAGSHFLPGIVGLRESLINKLGRKCYFASYGAISLLFLVWLIGSANRAPFVELWPSLPWKRHVPGGVMPIACFLAVAGIGTRSPFYMGSRRDAVFDPADLGLAALTRQAAFRPSGQTRPVGRFVGAPTPSCPASVAAHRGVSRLAWGQWRASGQTNANRCCRLGCRVCPATAGGRSVPGRPLTCALKRPSRQRHAHVLPANPLVCR